MAATPLTPDDPPRLGAFRLAGRLGEGGQGVVYLGHAPDGEPVAVKLLFGGDPETRARLSRELAALESVAPFCTARVLAASVDGPRPYVVSEFVDGPSLQERIRERGPLRDGELERLVVGTATALAAIHAAGVVHRDFKPANVLLGPDGPRVVDFGIARADGASTMTSGIIGTPAYMAPEQIGGAPASPASDVFAWAATMACAASGYSPFGADTLPAVLHRILNHHPDLSALPARFTGLIGSCLDKDPARRPTARSLMVSLVDPGAGSSPSTEDLARIGSRIASAPGGGGTGDAGRGGAGPGGAGMGDAGRGGAGPGGAGTGRTGSDAPGTGGAGTGGAGTGGAGTETTGTGRAGLDTRVPGRSSRGVLVGAGLAGAAILITGAVAAWSLLGGGGPAARNTPSDTGRPLASASPDVTGAYPDQPVDTSSDDGGNPDDVTDTGEPVPEPSGTAASQQQGGALRIPSAFAGTWSGHIKPTDPTGLFSLKEHDVKVDLASGRDSGSWTEPTSDCSGTLRLTKVGESALGFNLEVEDPLKCVPGALTLTRRGDRLAYHWTDGLGAGTFFDGELSRG
ncbi:serine/threonine-protein kinase [Streptosporangium carneum]|uniref:serine/threonine-protein kinase n=1 Tax=Streptosporangium carneum TaxID=47481 RepID=UPI0031EF0498